MGYELDDLEFQSWQGKDIFHLYKSSRLALVHTQPPFKYIKGTLSLGVKQRRHEADHSPPSNAEVKIDRSFNTTPPRCLNYIHKDNFTFYHNCFCHIHKICTRCH
jgi:hypothetical protein